MPELDGLAATARIRELEAARGGHIPIIALTANAFEEDRKRCLQAGMDDFIAKPFKAEELLATLAASAISTLLAQRVFQLELPVNYGLWVYGPLAGIALLSLNAWLSARKVLTASPAMTLREG